MQPDSLIGEYSVEGKSEQDESLEAIAGGSDFSDVVFNLIAWAERNCRLFDLLDGATTAVPGNARLKECAASINPYLA